MPQKSQSAAFEAIAVPNLTALYRKALHMLGDPGAAEDVVQDTCLCAWQNFTQFELGTNGRAWLFGILLNVVRHEYRRRRRWRVDPNSQQLLEGCPAVSSANAIDLPDKQLLGAVESLPRPFRQTLLLADVEELQYQEIAELLGIPIGTVMSRVSRARERLRSQLMGSLGDQ